jgi:hypothetical protein
MRTFALEPFDLVRGHNPFLKLKVNSSCPIDEFWNEISRDGNLRRQLKKAVSTMQQLSDGQTLPPQKYKMIKQHAVPVNMYEVKTSDLRIYLFRNSAGHVVVCRGKKSGQDRDISWFRGLVTEYLNQTRRR